jgi:hypothetical protein
MSKGSKQRPFDYETFSQNYDRIFGKPRKQLTQGQVDKLVELTQVQEDLGLYEEPYCNCGKDGLAEQPK